MRIIIISDVYFPRVNGVSTSIRTFRRELEALGHEVFLVVPDYGEETGDEEQVYRVPSTTLRFDPEDRRMGFRAVMSLEEELRSLQPDLVHIQTPFVAHYAGLRLAKRLNVPTVLTYHTYFEEYLDHYIPFIPRFLLQWLVRFLTRRQCSQVDSVVVPTAAFSRVLREYGVRSELYINPTGIDLQRFTAGDGERFRRQYGISRERPVMGFVGRMVHEKNIEFLLHVLGHLREQIPDLLLLLAGEGPAQKYLQKQVELMGLQENIRFVGNLASMQALCDCYAAGDVFVFASRTETQGLVLLEAMALGVPVVSIAKMGTVDILRPKKGALVVEEDVEAFAEAVSRLLNDETLRRKTGEEGRDYASTWSAQAMAMRLEDIYMETVESAFLFGREIGNSRGV